MWIPIIYGAPQRKTLDSCNCWLVINWVKRRMQTTSFFMRTLEKPNVSVWWMEPTMMGARSSSHLFHSVLWGSGWNIGFCARMQEPGIPRNLCARSDKMPAADFCFDELICHWLDLNVLSMEALSSSTDYWRVFNEIKCDDTTCDSLDSHLVASIRRSHIRGL